ncbi:MAG: SAF domain-containing protein [Gemmatimonadales bacterium]
MGDFARSGAVPEAGRTTEILRSGVYGAERRGPGAYEAGAHEAAYTEVEGGSAPPPARSLERRGGLPGGRAVVGGLLVIIAAVGVFAAYTQAVAPPRTEWVVASRDIASGQRIDRDDLKAVAITLPESLQRRAFARAAAPQLLGAVAVAQIGAEELLQRSDVARAEPGQAIASEEISFAIPVDRAVNGALQLGERVDVLGTYPTQEGTCTRAVIRNALLVAVSGQGGEERTLTLGVDSPGQSEAVADAVNNAELVVVRTTARRPSAALGFACHPGARR